MVNSSAGSRYVRNLNPDLEVSRDLDLFQIEIVQCQKGQSANVLLPGDIVSEAELYLAISFRVSTSIYGRGGSYALLHNSRYGMMIRII